jgi:hypothetical protein
MNNIKLVLFLFPILFLISCSSSIEETREEEIGNGDENYVFDNIPVRKDKVEEELPVEEKSFFKIQIGAFTSKQRAEIFAKESEKKLDREVEFFYSSSVNLFVVQLKERFYTKKGAETTRNQLKDIEDYRDAWIISVIK